MAPQPIRGPDGLAAKLAMFADKGRVFRYREDLFKVPNWVQVLIGQGVIPAGHDPLADSIPAAPALAAKARGRANPVAPPRHAR